MGLRLLSELGARRKPPAAAAMVVGVGCSRSGDGSGYGCAERGERAQTEPARKGRAEVLGAIQLDFSGPPCALEVAMAEPDRRHQSERARHVEVHRVARVLVADVDAVW